MFTGAINQDSRAILYEMAKEWKDKTIYVGCSGNFTIERVLNKAGITDIHSNDISLYSSVLGHIAIGSELEVVIKDPDYLWLEEYMKTPTELVATLLICMQMFQSEGRQEAYHKRMYNEYMRTFDRLHKETVERIGPELDDIESRSYFAGDVIKFFQEAPEDVVAVSFPPTYAKGYEKLYEKIDQVFGWDDPEYDIFDDDSFDRLVDVMTSKKHWFISKDEEIPKLEDYLVGKSKMGLRSKAVYFYSNFDMTKLSLSRQKTAHLNVARINERDEITADSEVKLFKINQHQMNLLRSEYLSVKILPAPANLNLGIAVDNKLIGAIAFAPSKYGSGEKPGVYMMTDFAINTSNYLRLSKLVLAMTLTKELKSFLESELKQRVETISTTAFTDKNVSMKYRGLYEVHNRGEGMINYEADAGKWDIKGGLEWWLKKHSKKQIND